jgi:hypothetical protein
MDVNMDAESVELQSVNKNQVEREQVQELLRENTNSQFRNSLQGTNRNRCFGIVVLIVITVVITAELGIMLTHHQDHEDLQSTGHRLTIPELQSTRQPVNVSEDYSSQNTNGTLCSYLKQFRLSQNRMVSVCNYQGSVRIDLRRYINKPSIQGIWLNKLEWTKLQGLWGAIQSAISMAEKSELKSQA